MSKFKIYEYQKNDVNQILSKIEKHPSNYNILYQLPTGGGKTVIFSEIARQYIINSDKNVLILTHRIELSRQTSKMLFDFNVNNKVIESTVKLLPDQEKYRCFVAMVETLNNRLNSKDIELNDIGLVIIDEAHYNSFRKLFTFFNESVILGVTATPLSSNIKLPMKNIYNELICGSPISYLVENGFLANAETYTYNVGLGGLKLGINGDYTVKSSDILYSKAVMQNKLLNAYIEKSLGKKTLIFNSGISTSLNVLKLFTDAGYEIRHLDSTHNSNLRKETLKWFKEKPDAILTSIGILTTGFDEPTVETIILNRATRSLTLYFQMIGRGSRILPSKNKFNVIDLGNNAVRFGLWQNKLDWHYVYESPDFFVDNLMSDAEIERQFVYIMPEEVKEKFNNTPDISFDVKENFDAIKDKGLRTATVLDLSISQHAQMCVENSEDIDEAKDLATLLKDDISDRIRRFSYCIAKSTKSYISWLNEDYNRKLMRTIRVLSKPD